MKDLTKYFTKVKAKDDEGYKVKTSSGDTILVPLYKSKNLNKDLLNLMRCCLTNSNTVKKRPKGWLKFEATDIVFYINPKKAWLIRYKDKVGNCIENSGITWEPRYD